MTKVGILVRARERILELIFGSNGVSSATDENLLDNKIAETMQYVNSQNLDINSTWMQNFFPKMKTNLQVMWQEKWLGKMLGIPVTIIANL